MHMWMYVRSACIYCMHGMNAEPAPWDRPGIDESHDGLTDCQYRESRQCFSSVATCIHRYRHPTTYIRIRQDLTADQQQRETTVAASPTQQVDRDATRTWVHRVSIQGHTRTYALMHASMSSPPDPSVDRTWHQAPATNSEAALPPACSALEHWPQQSV